MTSTKVLHKFAVKNKLVEKYLLDELEGMDREDFELHMWECPACLEQVKLGRAFVKNISGDELPAKTQSPFALSVAIAVAAVLIGLVVCLLVWGKVQ